jgi:hypothetical protein
MGYNNAHVVLFMFIETESRRGFPVLRESLLKEESPINKQWLQCGIWAPVWAPNWADPMAAAMQGLSL